MMRHATSFVAGIIGAAVMLAATQQPLPPVPSWVSTYCTDASPCTPMQGPFQGLAFAIDWFESDGTPCPEPATNEHPQTPCGPGAFIGHWVLLTRGDVHHGGSAIDHDVMFVANSPIYGGPVPQIELPGNEYALGAVMAFGLPPTATAPQAPALPVLDPNAWQTWFDAACANSSTCGAGVLSQPEFNALLATSPFLDHVHDLDAGTITIGGAQVTTSTGR